MSLEIVPLVITEFQQNCRILVDSASSSAVVVDPGGEATEIISEIERRGLQLHAIWLTHAHLDHCGAVAEILERFPVELVGHPDERELRGRVVAIAEMYGIATNGMRDCPEPSRYLRGGETITFAGHSFEVFFSPGHSPGHLCFYNAAGKFVLSGDVLFAGSIGRTDLPGGDHPRLLRSIAELAAKIPGETRVLSGHGPDTTLERELKSNPFLTSMRR